VRSVAGIAVRGGLVFVARRLPVGEMGGKWEFPGGKLEPGETDADAARREFREEFGVDVTPGRPLGESSFNHGGKLYRLAAIEVDMPRDPRELREHDAVRWTDGPGLSRLDMADSDRSLVPFVLPLLVRS